MNITNSSEAAAGGCSCGHGHDGGHSHENNGQHAHTSDCHSCRQDSDSHEAGCSCGHDHTAGVDKKHLTRILSGGVLLAAGLVFTHLLPALPAAIGTALLLISYAVVGYDVVFTAVRNLLRGRLFDENFLMALATIGAMLIGDFGEGVAVMLFYQVGELFQTWAVTRSRRSISELMDIRPDFAVVQRDGIEASVPPQSVAVGEIIVVRPGEKIPLDGRVTSGSSHIDTAALTGESAPREALPGDDVLSGCINLSGVLTVEVAKPFGESTVAKVLELVENASSQKAETENFITRFARVYTPAVVIVALLLAVIPPLFFGGVWGDWVYRALTFLVISCPCALVISIPLGFFGGIGGASKCGVLIKGGNYLEALSKTDIVVFDKTGTLTKGVFEVSALCPAGRFSERQLLETAALAESGSNHPISRSIVSKYALPIDKARVSGITEQAGFGLSAVVDGHAVQAGNRRLMEREGIVCEASTPPGTIVHLAMAGEYMGYILIADSVKPDSRAAIDALRALGVRKTVMLTGDSDAVGRSVAAQLGLDEVYTELLPGDKVERMQTLLREKRPGGMLAFVGDGINDAPVLAGADIGIAMGALGSDAAIEAADVVLMTDEPSRIATAVSLSRRTLAIIRQNIVFALGVKALVLLLGAFGISTMWEAVFADVGVSVIAILNAVRALNVSKYQD